MEKAYGYARVSTKEQNLDRQINSISDYCKEHDISIDVDRDIIKEHISGKDFKRERYLTLKEELLRPGDTLIIKELDRLGRNMEMIKEEWRDLEKRGINIIVIDTEILNTVGKSDLEKTLISNIVFELLSYMAEKERVKIRQRQAEGIAAAKAKGKKLGRPGIEYPEHWEEAYAKWKKGEITAVKVMELTQLKKNSFYNLVKKYEK
ncbi:recombinase family protein [Clostridium sp. YIM B02555]|uniref:recombinase family protein n=1 Tax=Clostridium sp. YIM B02555 TaxID=2911968 RepID=UPI001EEE7B04|nr:recombinase family protein [Clostridium sp. YIM B02555]